MYANIFINMSKIIQVSYYNRNFKEQKKKKEKTNNMSH